MRIKITAMLLVMVALLAACGGGNDESMQIESTADLKELVNDYSTGNADVSANHQASITAEQLIISDDDGQTTYDLPEDEFFISIAPFIDETHTWTDHSLTGCQGELVKETFDIKVEDQDGKVILEETRETEQNGFVDLWLPRGETFEVTIMHEDKEVEAEISTFDTDPTCITTMQLS